MKLKRLIEREVIKQLRKQRLNESKSYSEVRKELQDFESKMTDGMFKNKNILKDTIDIILNTYDKNDIKEYLRKHRQLSESPLAPEFYAQEGFFDGVSDIYPEELAKLYVEAGRCRPFLLLGDLHLNDSLQILTKGARKVFVDALNNPSNGPFGPKAAAKFSSPKESIDFLNYDKYTKGKDTVFYYAAEVPEINKWLQKVYPEFLEEADEWLNT